MEAQYDSNFVRHLWNSLQVTQELKNNFINRFQHFYFPKMKNGSVGQTTCDQKYFNIIEAQYGSNFVQHSWILLKVT